MGVASVTIDVRWRISRSECGMQDPPFAFAGASEAADEASSRSAPCPRITRKVQPLPPRTKAYCWLVAVATRFMFPTVNEGLS